MLEPRSLEGGGIETYNIVPDVTITRDLVTIATANYAARTAIRLANEGNKLPYVSTEQTGIDGSVFSRIRLLPKDGVIGLRDERRKPKNFFSAVEALCDVAEIDAGVLKTVVVMIDAHGSGRPLHQDIYDGKRSFLQLSGARLLCFEQIPVFATTTVDLSSGDAYMLQMRNDFRSIYHSAEYIGDPCVAIYIDH